MKPNPSDNTFKKKKKKKKQHRANHLSRPSPTQRFARLVWLTRPFSTCSSAAAAAAASHVFAVAAAGQATCFCLCSVDIFAAPGGRPAMDLWLCRRGTDYNVAYCAGSSDFSTWDHRNVSFSFYVHLSEDRVSGMRLAFLIVVSVG